VCLRRWWPRWREALVLVQPATVARWHREGFRGCWRRRSRRRRGRPRIYLQLRNLIGRMATENGLWGAPRIHGELMKLGITVSERTVSRYLPDRRTRRSQTWRTFLANHIGILAFTSTVISSCATSDDDVEASVQACRPVPPARDRWHASNQWVFVDWPSLQPPSPGCGVPPNQVRRGTHARFSSGKDPPNSWAVNLCWRYMPGGSLRSETPSPLNEPMRGRRRSDSESLVAIGKLWLALRAITSSTPLLSRHYLRSRLEARTSTSDSQNIGEAQP
jgi:hypothetical protein